MNGFHLIMPMGGRGQRFFDNGFEIPKPLIEINGRPFFYWSAMSVLSICPDCDVTFVVLQEHIDNFSIDKKIQQFFPTAEIVVLDHVLDGAVLTCLSGVQHINDNRPLLFNDCDHMFGCNSLKNLTDTELEQYDGFLLTFESDLDKYSYAKLDLQGNVTATAEKKVISTHAICGAYYFRNKDTFVNSANKYLTECTYSEFFMSGVYNSMIESGLRTGILKTDYHISFGTPEEYYQAVNRPEFEELL